MGFWKQFEIFDPLKGESPRWPHFEGFSVIWRARSILRGRTADQIHRLAHDASFSIDSYFENEKEATVAQLIADRDEEFIEFELHRDGGVTGRLRPEKEDDLDIPTSDNTSEIDALRESIGGWTDLSEDEVPGAQEFEYFAAMALWQVGDAIEEIDYKYDYKNSVHVKRTEEERKNINTKRVGEYLLRAMESVCYAEHLQDVDRLTKKFEERIERLKAAQKTAYEQAEQAIRTETTEQLREEESRRRVERAKELSRLRHGPRDAAKEEVLTDWVASRDAFPSAEKAGNHYVEWLVKRGHAKYEPRTVTSWIRAYAKENNIRLR